MNVDTSRPVALGAVLFLDLISPHTVSRWENTAIRNPFWLIFFPFSWHCHEDFLEFLIKIITIMRVILLSTSQLWGSV